MKLIIVEGKDDKLFFEELLGSKYFENQKNFKVTFPSGGGVEKISKLQQIDEIFNRSEFEEYNFESVILICDADADFNSRKDSLTDLQAKLEKKYSAQEFEFYILPDNQNSGFLEEFLLEIISENQEDKFITRVNRFGEEIEKIEEYNKLYLPKLKMISYLYSATGGNRGISNAIESYRNRKKREEFPENSEKFFLNFESENESLKKLKSTLKKFLKS
jgi:hypothetical protein